MSLRTSIAYGRFGHVFYDGWDCAYHWESQSRRWRLRLPGLRIWRWLAHRGI